MKPLHILDPEYIEWIKELSSRYRVAQIQASLRVNHETLNFYWQLGRDIDSQQAENRYGSRFYATLSRDLRTALPDASGLTENNLRYATRFYRLYNGHIKELKSLSNLPQLVEDLPKASHQGLTLQDLISIPWGHHRTLIDKCSSNPLEAIFYVKQTLENGWSRTILLNFISSNLYARQGKALTNFARTLPPLTSGLAQELTRDPYNFAFTNLTTDFNERKLKDALLKNITDFLLELGTGFAYVGKEYRLQVGEQECFIDLLFYNLNLSCYIVIEVKLGKFDFADTGQLGGYVVACNHILRREGRDNPTIGLLICKEHDNLKARYALEASSLPLGISDYELSRLYPEKVEGTIPTVEEIETRLLDNI